MKNTKVVNASIRNDTWDEMFKVMERLAERNCSRYIDSAVEHYNKIKTEELDKQDKTKFRKETIKPILKKYFKSLRVAHIPESYILGTDASIKKTQKYISTYLNEDSAGIDAHIIKDAILELTLEEER